MIASLFLSMQLWIAQADQQNGSLEIDINNQEVIENKNKDLNQYDTNLFNDDSQTINNKLKEKQMNQMKDIKHEMFQDNANESSRLSVAKNQLFQNDKKKTQYDKIPYLQDRQEQNIATYIMMAIGLIILISIIIITQIRRRKRGSHETL